MDHFCQQVQQKDVGRRLQVGQELLEYLRDPAASPDVEQDPQRLDKVIDELAAWVNSSNFKVRGGEGPGRSLATRTGRRLARPPALPPPETRESGLALANTSRFLFLLSLPEHCSTFPLGGHPPNCFLSLT